MADEDQSLARKKIDLIYEDILGEVHALLNHVEALKNGLPAAAAEFNDTITPNIGVMVDTANKLRHDAAALVTAVKNAAKDAAEVAGDKAIDKIAQITTSEANRLKTISDNLAHEIGTKAAIEVQRLVAVPVERAVDNVKAVATGMDTAKDELESAAATVRMVMWQRVAWTFGAALLGAVLAIGAAKAFGWLGGNAGGKMDEIMLNQQNIQSQIEASCKPKK